MNMKTVPAAESNGESPKTPGGISKTLWTPCRRVGLSRNWKKGSLSPFISPLSSSSTNIVNESENRKGTRKRKERTDAKDSEDESLQTPTSNDGMLNIDVENIIKTPPVNKSDNLNNTPCRNFVIPLKKKSKTLLSTINNSKENISDGKIKFISKDNPTIEAVQGDNPDKICTSVSKSPKGTKLNSNIQKVKIIEHSNNELINEVECDDTNKTAKQKSPNELTKKCILVIQERLSKTKKKDKEASNVNKSAEENEVVNCKIKSQELFDSASGDIPFNKLNKAQNEPRKEKSNINCYDNFIETSNEIKGTKLEPENTNETKDSVNNKCNKNKSINISKSKMQIETVKSSQFDDDEDFNFYSKITIPRKKAYDKVTYPLRAKSTGSITDSDINQLRTRLEMKKKLLIAKAMSDDTLELRTLIKKWQKGCQDALTELMDLMKIKCLDKQNMSYSEILQILNIPSSLVGYDSDNECFNTPDDTNIILSVCNDL